MQTRFIKTGRALRGLLRIRRVDFWNWLSGKAELSDIANNTNNFPRLFARRGVQRDNLPYGVLIRPEAARRERSLRRRTRAARSKASRIFLSLTTRRFAWWATTITPAATSTTSIGRILFSAIHRSGRPLREDQREGRTVFRTTIPSPSTTPMW